jgi:hypothetical protein
LRAEDSKHDEVTPWMATANQARPRRHGQATLVYNLNANRYHLPCCLQPHWTAMPRLPLLIVLALGTGLVACTQEKLPEQTLVLENHRFTPSEITIPAGTKLRIVIDNRDDSSEEFDSDSLGREKVVAAKSSGAVVIGPLKPGRYPFMGEFHHQTAQGAVIVQ